MVAGLDDQRWGMGAEDAGDYARLAGLYGVSFVRLARLLKSTPDERGLLGEAFSRDIHTALAEVVQEFK